MAPYPSSVLSICAGVGGGDLALRLAFPCARTVMYLEREAFAVEVLVRRMEEGFLDQAPVWSDLGTFDGRPWRGRVDCILASLPCTPYSCAGKRLGHADDRAIWPEFIRVVGEVEPALVFLENVPEFVRHLREPGEELSRLGYRLAEPIFVSAEDVGGAHGRERMFAMAYRDGGGLRTAECDIRTRESDTQGRGGELADRLGPRWTKAGVGRHEHSGAEPEAGDGELVGAARPGRHGCDREAGGSGRGAREGVPELVGSFCCSDCLGESPCYQRSGIMWCDDNICQWCGGGSQSVSYDTEHGGTRHVGEPYRPPVDDDEDSLADARDGQLPQPGRGAQGRDGAGSAGEVVGQPLFYSPPYRTGDCERWEYLLVRQPWLRPALSPAEAESIIRRVSDGLAGSLDILGNRIDRLRVVGNGIYPLAGAVAFRLLWEAVKKA